MKTMKPPNKINMDSPLLMIPAPDDEGRRTNNNLCLLNVTNEKTFTTNALQCVEDCLCIGSSHGWLAFTDRRGDPFLLNPFSDTRIRLPRKRTLPNVHHVEEIDKYGEFKVHFKQGLPVHYSSANYGEILIHKAVLSTNPSYNNKYVVAIIYEEGLLNRKLAFCRHGDKEWSDLECIKDGYHDIVCSSDHNTNMLFALGMVGLPVEAWDLNEQIPTKKLIVKDSFPRRLIEAKDVFTRGLYTNRRYLALSSSGKIYLVVRYLGGSVRPYDGKVVYQGSEPMECPYKTVQFHVYKLDVDQKLWTEVHSLNDVALFLGGNHSMVLSIDRYPGLRGNSIYFTDDNWYAMDEGETYGGHDLGIFNLKDGNIDPLIVESDCEVQRIEPPPFWIINYD